MSLCLGDRLLKNRQLSHFLVRTLVLISELSSSVIIVDHQPRDTTWEVKLADRLSREKTMTSQDRSMLRSFKGNKLPNNFQEWMRNPVEDWDMPRRIVDELSNFLFHQK